MMTQDEIIEMARQAKLFHFYDSEGHCTGITDDELITAEKERNDERLVEMLMPFAKLVAQHEREACAKIVEESSLPDTYSQECLPEIANDIRARGQA